MPKKKVTSAAKTKGAPRARSRVRWLVWVDQGPLRSKAASECGRAMERLEKVRADWKRFEREDQPAFRRWVASTFGVLMSRVREIGALVREKEALAHEVEREMYLSGTNSYRTAYTRVQERRANPSAGPDPRDRIPPHEEERSQFPEEEEEELSAFEQELLFEEFLRTILGMNPDRMSDRQYAKMLADFKATVLGRPPPGRGEEREEDPESAPDALPASPKSGPDRVKELYRLLVRRLHPDVRADNNAEVSAIWHDVQEAYAAGNIERLEMLLAFTDIQSNTAGEHTSLFQMHSVLAELRRAVNAVQRNLGSAKKDHAWNFTRLKDRAKIEVRVRREMESTLDWHERQLRELEALIAQWSAPSKRQRKQAEFRY